MLPAKLTATRARNGAAEGKPRLESAPNIRLCTKLSILQDVSRGLIYLHSRAPAVIHRDLTARNVLLDSAMRAKIADLGNSRIVHLLMKSLSQQRSGLS